MRRLTQSCIQINQFLCMDAVHGSVDVYNIIILVTLHILCIMYTMYIIQMYIIQKVPCTSYTPCYISNSSYHHHFVRLLRVIHLFLFLSWLKYVGQMTFFFFIFLFYLFNLTKICFRFMLNDQFLLYIPKIFSIALNPSYIKTFVWSLCSQLSDNVTPYKHIFSI